MGNGLAVWLVTVWCELEGCCHNASGRCAVHSITLVIGYAGRACCATYDHELEVEGSGSKLLVDDPLEGWY